MSVSFKIIDAPKQEGWNSFVDKCPQGDVLQYWQWGEVKRSEGWEPIRIRVERDKEVLLQAQILVKDAKFLGKYAYIPHGPIASEDENLKLALPKFKEGILDLAKENGWFVVEIEPKLGIPVLTEGEELWAALKVFDNPDQLSLFGAQGFRITGRNMQPKYKLFYDLDFTEDELMQFMKKNTRYNVRLAERKGVVVNKYLPDDPQIEEKLEDFYVALEAMQERASGYPIRPISTFKDLFKEFKGSNNLILFEVAYKGDTIAYNISEFTGMWSSSFYAGSYRIHNKVKAPYLLRWASVLEAKARGIPLYDFWGIIPNNSAHKGYSDNKLSFGGQRVNYYGLLSLPVKLPQYLIWNYALPLRGRLYAALRALKG